MADGYGIDQLEALIEERIQQGYGFDPSKLNDSVQELMRYIEKIYDRTAKDSKGLTEKEITSAMKEIRDLLKSSGATTKETATYMSVWTNELKGLVKSGIELNKERLQYSANANFSNMAQLGVLDPNRRSAENNVMGQTLKEYLPKNTKAINEVGDKIITFLNVEKGQYKKKARAFIDDLVEGLARSKFVGGAFTDLVRLATFFAASWLKNHGLLGKALAVGLVALGPIIGTAIANILTKALVSGITNVLKTGLLSLGTLLKATFMSFFRREAFATALGAKGSTVMGMSRGNLALGTGLAAVGLGVAAHHEWKEGRKGSAVAFGIGSAGFGVGAIASLLAPFFPLLAPIAPIAIAVGAVAAGVGLIIKFWPKIAEFFDRILQKLGLMTEKDSEGNAIYRDRGRHIADQVAGTGAPGKRAKLSKNPTKQSELEAWAQADNSSRVQISESGLIMNMGEMTQGAISGKLTEYFGKSKDDKKGQENLNKFLGNYDLIPENSPYASFASFQTDAIWKDIFGVYGKAGMGYILAPKGTLDKLAEVNKVYHEKGGKGDIKLSSAYGTAGKRTKSADGSFSYLTTPHGGQEHFRITDPALDFIGYGNAALAGNAAKEVYGGGQIINEGDHLHFQKMLTALGQQIWANYKNAMKESSNWAVLPADQRNKGYMVQAAQKNLAIAEDKLEQAVKAREEYLKEHPEDQEELKKQMNTKGGHQALLSAGYSKLTEEISKATTDAASARALLDKVKKKNESEFLEGTSDLTGNQVTSGLLKDMNMLTLISWKQQ